jgi:hypothetical protein
MPDNQPAAPAAQRPACDWLVTLAAAMQNREVGASPTRSSPL